MKKYCSYGRRAIGIFGFKIFLLGNGLTKTGTKIPVKNNERDNSLLGRVLGI